MVRRDGARERRDLAETKRFQTERPAGEAHRLDAAAHAAVAQALDQAPSWIATRTGDSESRAVSRLRVPGGPSRFVFDLTRTAPKIFPRLRRDRILTVSA
jgi:hypothetical protein